MEKHSEEEIEKLEKNEFLVDGDTAGLISNDQEISVKPIEEFDNTNKEVELETSNGNNIEQPFENDDNEDQFIETPEKSETEVGLDNTIDTLELKEQKEEVVVEETLANHRVEDKTEYTEGRSSIKSEENKPEQTISKDKHPKDEYEEDFKSLKDEFFGPTYKIEQTNGPAVGSVGNDFNYYAHDGKSKIRVGDWEESVHHNIIDIDGGLIQRLSEKLVASRLLLLNCLNDDYIDEIIDLIVRKTQEVYQYENHKRKIYWCEEDQQDSQDKITIRDFTDSAFKQNNCTYVKVHLSELKLLTSLFIHEKEKYTSLLKDLEKNKIFLICKIERELFDHLNPLKTVKNKVSMDNLRDHSLFPFVKIPFIDAIIAHYFPERATELVKKLYHQRENKLWGNNTSEGILHDQLMELFKENPHRVLDAIKERENPTEFLNNNRTIVEGLPFNEEPHKTAMFVTAFFPEINISDFRSLMHFLLKDKHVLIQNGKLFISENDSESKRKSAKLVPAIEVWKEYGDAILEKCEIKTRRLEDGRICYDFTTLSIEDNVAIHTKTHYSLYLLSQYERLMNTDYFFDFRTSSLLVKNLIQLVVEVAMYDPEKYVTQLLREIFFKLLYKDREISFDEEIQLSKDEISQLRNIRDFEIEVGFRRLIDLIKHFLGQHEFLRNKVNKFFNDLLDLGLYHHLLIFVKIFSSDSLINPIIWINKILLRNPDETTYSDLIEFLIKDIRYWGGDTSDRLRQMYQWLPSESHNKKYTKLQVYASLVIYEIGNPVVCHFGVKLYGLSPTKFPILVPLLEEKDPLSYLSFLLTWLFNPHTAHIFEGDDGKNLNNLREMERQLMKKRAFVIESWLLILTGIEVTQNPQEEDFSQLFVRAIKLSISTSHLHGLTNVLGRLTVEYSKNIKELKGRFDETGVLLYKLYRAKKRIVKQLKVQLNTN